MAARKNATTTVRLRPQNPFDLIRLLARSQSDPRKAVAELVQNSLDAGASTIEIQWFNERGKRALSIWDDGRGVFPEMEREDALRRIAQTVGHSHKRDLTPSERREEMILGKYGIGLIGFWSVGKILEMRSRVGGGKASVLRLVEDRERGEVFVSRARLLEEPDTFTEIVVREIHEAAQAKIRPPRLQAYLAQELRGQLLERGAVVTIRDRVARGRARKHFVVQAQPFLGRPIEDLRTLDVPGFEDARIELYQLLPDEERRGVVALACGGTTVLDDIAEIDGAGEARRPWSGGRFEGVIDFPDLHVAPASRRGFAHDEPVTAFLASLQALEAELETRVEQDAERRRSLQHEHLARDIRKAFSSVAMALPEYDFFDVRGKAAASRASAGAASGAEGEPEHAPAHDPALGVEECGSFVGSNPPTPTSADSEVWPSHARAHGDESSGEGAQAPPDAGVAAPPRERESTEAHGPASAGDATSSDGMLFPPGPLAHIALSPKSMRVELGASRELRVEALDDSGRPCAGPLAITWRLDGPGEVRVQDDAAQLARFDAPAQPVGERVAQIHVQVTQGDTRCEASCKVRFKTPSVSVRAQGIPEPHAVSDPAGSWRSRLVDGRWEFNDAHRDFALVADVEARRLRYLIHLFAKEIVLRNFGGPADAEVLERMVEVLTQLDASGRR